jgi:O-antigen/teichoic acid export membrane protein
MGAEAGDRIEETSSIAVVIDANQSSESAVSSALRHAAPHTSLLDRALIQGIAWTGALKWGSQIVSWTATLIVARLLSPRDYGLLAMATLYLGFVSVLSEFGVGAAVVVLRDLAEEQIAQINTLSVLFGIAAFAISCALAFPLGIFFNSSELPAVVIVLSVSFIILSFRSVPYSLLQNDLRFKLLALLDGAQTAISACSMIALAFLGFRYWTLVVGSLLAAVLSTAFTLAVRRYPFAWPRFRSLRHAITFSWHIVAARVLFFAYSSADIFVGGKVLGNVAIGAYSFAAGLATMLPEKVTSLLGCVTPAIFATVQTDAAALRRYVLSLSEGIALITFPATLGIAMVAEDFVLAALGEKWRVIIGPLRILAAYAGLRSLTPLIGQVLNHVGETRYAMRVQMVAIVLFPLAFYEASRWGAIGLALGWVVMHPLVSLPVYWRAFQKIELPARQYLNALAPALSASAVMLLAIWISRGLIPGDWPRLTHLALLITIGALAYLMALITFHRERVRVFYETCKLVRT